MNKNEIENKVHPLGSGKTGKIRFIHSDGKEYSFCSTINSMGGDRMSWFSNAAPTVGDSASWVKSVFKDIREKAEVLESIGDF